MNGGAFRLNSAYRRSHPNTPELVSKDRVRAKFVNHLRRLYVVPIGRLLSSTGAPTMLPEAKTLPFMSIDSRRFVCDR